MLLADVAPTEEEESVEFQYGEQMSVYVFLREEMVHLGLVAHQGGLLNHNVDNISTMPLLEVHQVEVGDIHVKDDFPSQDPLEVHNRLAGLGSCVLELDEMHAYADGDSCDLTLHGVRVIQGVVEHVYNLYRYEVVVPSRVKGVYMVQRLLLMVAMK